MSRNRERRRPRRTGGARRKPQRRAKAAIITLTILAIGAGAAVLIRERSPSDTPARDAENTGGRWGSVPANMTPDDAFRRGVELEAAGRYREALPLLESVARSDAAPWFVHDAYAAALHKYAMLTWSPEQPRAAPRTSFERMQIAKESLEHFQKAVELLANDVERATVLWARGQVYNTWGFPWEAYTDFRAASTVDSSLRRHLDVYREAMRNTIDNNELW